MTGVAGSPGGERDIQPRGHMGSGLTFDTLVRGARVG